MASSLASCNFFDDYARVILGFIEMFWFVCSIIAVALSPIGRAIGERFSGKAPIRTGGEELRDMSIRIEDRIFDLEDRVEAAEQLLGVPGGRTEGR